ncbi:hypothetical protein N6L27_21310 [Leisingera sp. SS27]|uniref:hypothetical protein n=1 Tax=Leisingera sp. SS27 TaxID=2979462 RepID=UPI00232DBC9A|nr:hypothetical protein [Leisingera sp. SS27]MDC0660551.1 hypothetical protein [Leisingera sp. SS27]
MIAAGFKTASDGFAREAALLHMGKPSLLFWQSDEPTLVQPTNRSDGGNISTLAKSAGWTVVHREGVEKFEAQGPGLMNMAMVVPYPDNFEAGTGCRIVFDTIAEALRRFEIDSEIAINEDAPERVVLDFLSNGQKFGWFTQQSSVTPNGRVALLRATIHVDTSPFATLAKIEEAMTSNRTGAARHPRIAMDALLAPGMMFHSFLGALARAAEDRLTALVDQKKLAA